MPRPKRTRAPTRRAAKTSPTARSLERRVATLTRALDAERRRHARQIAALRRGHDRRLATLVQEIAGLRHHEARAELLARHLAERDAALAAHAQRVADLEKRLQNPSDMG